ncbi:MULTISPECIES: hypothetical protein [unclassified Micromonospora]|uniref:hypothetical protein n=1 Tax=unclassified Micromonospora TaxID=2617518 RepID=UPI0033175444
MPDGRRYESPRLWLYHRDAWDPAWHQKLGFPYLGGDEWGRRTVVIGLRFVGYLVWAWRTCWCQECHDVREQTYRLLATDEADS